MKEFAAPVERLAEHFQKMPGIGLKSAQKLAFYVVSMPEEQARDFADAILSASASVKRCTVCQNLTDGERCSICADETRDEDVICVVSDPRDVAAFERTREYHGLYHVLHGVLSPLAHIGPDDLTVKALVERVGKTDVREIIMATNPDTEGEATAVYLSRLLRPFGVKITRIAYGVPVGGHLEFADEVTLSHALDGRQEMTI
ncbi:MAG: recombination mediator RecR [Clostridiaceae bacterium]|nr:recombination mediator RecR [Clostridiaceae bacterium]